MSVPVSPSRATQIAARTPAAPQLEGLARGSRGPDVMSLQRSLNARGANLDVDGKFGPLTEAALKSFQATSGCGGNGRVNGDSAKILSQTPTTKAVAEAAPATTTATTTKAAAEATTDSISAGGTCAAPTAVPMPTAAASTAAAAAVDGPAPAGVSLAPAQVKTALDNIELGRTQAKQEKEVLGEMRGALQREIKELETPLAGSASSASTASVADEAVLMGRRGQLDAVGKADELVDLKLKGFDAAEIAVKDGVLTEVEAKALTDVDTAYKTSEGAIANQMSSASSLVDKGIQAGGRGRPVLGLRKKAEEAASTTGAPATTTTTPAATTTTTAATAATTKPAGTAIASADVKQALSNIDAAKTAAKVELEAVGTARKGIQAEAYSLQGLTNKTPADQAVLDGRLAQLKVLDGAKENIELRIAGLDAAGKAVSDGVLTDDEASNLAKIDAGVTGGQQILSAQASMASEMIRMGLNAGGRGSAEALF